MKRYYIFSLLIVMLLTIDLTAQSGVSITTPDRQNSPEFQKLMEQYEANQLLDGDLPPGWEFSTSDKAHIISVTTGSNPNLCGVPIEPGDYIGVFYIDDNGEEACGGAGMWTGTANMALVAYGDDSYTPGKDGFSGGELMNWYVYSYSLGGQIFPATPEYDPSYASNNKFYSSGLSIVDNLEYFYDNDITIPAGWSGLSSYTTASTFPPIIGNVLEPISDELVLLQDMQKIYYPGAGINTMFIWTNGKGYKIKVDDDVVLPMMGCPVSSKTVSLSATWNIFPVLSQCNAWLTDVFGPVMNKVIVIKEIAGNRIYWPEMGIQSLQVLEPGKAYYVAVTQSTSVTYGDCQSLKSQPVSQEYSMTNLTPWNSPVETGFTHTIAFPASVLTSVSKGDYIAAFNSEGACTGMTQVETTGQNLALTVFGEDITTTENEGMNEGEEMIFKIFRTKTGEPVPAQVQFDGNYASADGLFADNGLSVASSLKVSSTGISEIGSSDFEIFPNPAANQITVRTTEDGNYHLQIRNMNGQLVISQNCHGTSQIDVSDVSRGVYTVELTGEQTKAISKLILR